MPYFTQMSAWNTKINVSNSTYFPNYYVQNVHLHDYKLGNTWINIEDVVHEAQVGAQKATWSYDVLNLGTDEHGFRLDGTKSFATPLDLEFAHGSDRWTIVLDPDGVTFHEVWGGYYDAATQHYSAAYMVEGNLLTDTGFGHDGVGAGVRASGASLLGGMVTQAELDALHIPHALAMELPPSMMQGGVNQADQFVFPAVSVDQDSIATYSGYTPMGAHFAIPQDVDLASAGLTPEGLALAKAYQTYGGYVVDTAAKTVSLGQFDLSDPHSTQAAHLFQDIDWIRANLTWVQQGTDFYF